MDTHFVPVVRLRGSLGLVSLDPAHNLSDIFETKLSDKARQIASRLRAIEIDQEKWIKRYLKEEFKGVPILKIPFCQTPLMGIKTLTKFIESNNHALMKQPLELVEE